MSDGHILPYYIALKLLKPTHQVLFHHSLVEELLRSEGCGECTAAVISGLVMRTSCSNLAKGEETDLNRQTNSMFNAFLNGQGRGMAEIWGHHAFHLWKLTSRRSCEQHRLGSKASENWRRHCQALVEGLDAVGRTGFTPCPPRRVKATVFSLHQTISNHTWTCSQRSTTRINKPCNWVDDRRSLLKSTVVASVSKDIQRWMMG